jgi:hypothetical protein
MTFLWVGSTVFWTYSLLLVARLNYFSHHYERAVELPIAFEFIKTGKNVVEVGTNRSIVSYLTHLMEGKSPR